MDENRGTKQCSKGLRTVVEERRGHRNSKSKSQHNCMMFCQQEFCRCLLGQLPACGHLDKPLVEEDLPKLLSLSTVTDCAIFASALIRRTYHFVKRMKSSGFLAQAQG